MAKNDRAPDGAAAWRQLDEAICRHPFLQQYSRQQRSAMQRGMAAAGVDEGAYREMRGRFVDFLADVLRIGPLIEKSLSGDPDGGAADGFFRSVLRTDRDYRELPKRERLRAQFDGVAYVTAVNNCIGLYDAGYINPETGRGASFLGLFLAEYRNRLHEIRMEYTTGVIRIPKKVRADLANIVRFLQDRFPDGRCRALPDSVYQELAGLFGLPLKTVRELVSAIWHMQTLSLDAPAGGSEEPLWTLLADGAQSAADSTDADADGLQSRLDMYAVIQALSSLELKDYNRQLMCNQLLYPIHPETYSPDTATRTGGEQRDASYKNALRGHHEQLKKSVWDLPYLSYVGWKSAQGEDGSAGDIDVLCNYYPVRPLLKQTIASYRHVDPANVSYHARKFNALCRQVKNMVYGGEEP